MDVLVALICDIDGLILDFWIGWSGGGECGGARLQEALEVMSQGGTVTEVAARFWL